MLHRVSGDMFAQEYDFLVITVNCVGVPGKGLALTWAKHEPALAARYKAMCARGALAPGSIVSFDGYILAATKDHWRNPSELAWVRAALAELRSFLCAQTEPVTVALPPLGAGLGGLSRRDVTRLVERTFDNDDDYDVYYFA